MILGNKLSNDFIAIFFLAICCGIMIYIAVVAIKEKEYFIAILSIVIFIINGFENSIANIFYYIMGLKSWEQVLFIVPHLIIVTVGNFIGCNIIPILKDSKN